jgi:hypothetical protein
MDAFNQSPFGPSGPVQNFKPSLSEILGPTYDYSSEIRTPGDIGVQFGNGSWDGINNAAAGVDYYSSTLGYGESAGMAKERPKMSQHPLGLRYFIKTGVSCSNGADMYQYVNTIPSGLRGRLGQEIETTLGVHLRGLAPGTFEDAAKALNPMPMFNAVMNSGYAKCRKVSLPVGDIDGNIVSRKGKKTNWWIDPLTVTNGPDGKPQVSHWIFDSWVSAEEYNSARKDYPKKDARGNILESFQSPPPLPLAPQGVGQPANAHIIAGVLFATLFAGLLVFDTLRK